MSAEKMYIFSKQMLTETSKLEDYEAEKTGREQGIKVIIDCLKKAYTERRITVEEAKPFLKKVEQCHAEGKITEANRNEYFTARKEDLVPFDQRIKEYQAAIKQFITRIRLLDEMIQKTGEKIDTLMTTHQAEAAQLTPQAAKYIFSYTRFSPALFQTPPPAEGIKPSANLKEVFAQSASSLSMDKPKGG